MKKFIAIYPDRIRIMNFISLHTDGNTWKYTLDISILRMVWWRLEKVNSAGKVPTVIINVWSFRYSKGFKIKIG